MLGSNHAPERMDNPLTIVEVTGRLCIGGVESHVSRLACGLMARGHRVILLAQDSGIFGEEARAAGAEVLIVPFNRDGRRHTVQGLRSRSVDLIHAHNYRAARYGARLAQALGTPYLMTVHGPRPWYQRALFRYWSDPVITVSAGDRDNIVGPFGVPADRVLVSFLAVDTERFRPGLDASSLRAEWEVPAGRPLIVHVSRFSHRKARPALALLEALPLVRDRVPGTSLVLVGSGPELKRIAARTERLNQAIGERVVAAVGSRTDVPQVMNAADVVVATATTAIESLVCGTPTIAFGRTGYFGVVAAENLERARAVCFADHGRLPGRTCPQKVAGDLISLLSDSGAARRSAAAVRALIARDYSVEGMIDQIEAAYREALSGRPA